MSRCNDASGCLLDSLPGSQFCARHTGKRLDRVTMVLSEEDRQLVLLALARLSVERPGWEDALHTLALQIDAQTEGRAIMFDAFRATAQIQRDHEKAGTP